MNIERLSLHACQYVPCRSAPGAIGLFIACLIACFLPYTRATAEIVLLNDCTRGCYMGSTMGNPGVPTETNWRNTSGAIPIGSIHIMMVASQYWNGVSVTSELVEVGPLVSVVSTAKDKTFLGQWFGIRARNDAGYLGFNSGVYPTSVQQVTYTVQQVAPNGPRLTICSSPGVNCANNLGSASAVSSYGAFSLMACVGTGVTCVNGVSSVAFAVPSGAAPDVLWILAVDDPGLSRFSTATYRLPGGTSINAVASGAGVYSVAAFRTSSGALWVGGTSDGGTVTLPPVDPNPESCDVMIDGDIDLGIVDATNAMDRSGSTNLRLTCTGDVAATATLSSREGDATAIALGGLTIRTSFTNGTPLVSWAAGSMPSSQQIRASVIDTASTLSPGTYTAPVIVTVKYE